VDGYAVKGAVFVYHNRLITIAKNQNAKIDQFLAKSFAVCDMNDIRAPSAQ
jgi:hypothetical protein